MTDLEEQLKAQHIEQKLERLDKLEEILKDRKPEFGDADYIEYHKLLASLSAIQLDEVRAYRIYHAEMMIAEKIKNDLNLDQLKRDIKNRIDEINYL